ncbi:Sorbicillinoid biosynthetic cluster transcription factor sor3 [Purpureocillium lavendulum]|uniref:Sorbicillinoid biosynthetic cluster transcription factor sor3 n=1 Tax=Purpureocillium lavendulum TaxID=1247861 RepID=A0AB34FFI5_9HYPO|nr:Sorbicillinoid biosynthetic cluster transcription factor sor3 [Purpureocillium lavendulum]
MASRKKTFFITGAGRGIGRGLSRLLLGDGHRVFLVDADATELEHTAGVLARSHRRGTDFEAARCDVRRPDEVRAAAARASSLFGPARGLDCLVNNAAYTGGVGGASLADLTLDEWNRSVETNLTGPMLVTQACLPMLRAATAAAKHTPSSTTTTAAAVTPSSTTTPPPPSSSSPSGGSSCVIHMSSTRAFMSEPDNEAYAATKAGLVGLAQSMAVSLARDGIRVNALLPGWIHVGDECRAADEAGARWEDGLSDADMRWHLTGRVGRVEDVMRAVVYLAESDGVSGVEMVVDGGVTRKMVYPE